MGTDPQQDRPKLRSDLNVTPAVVGRRRVWVIQDPIGLIKSPVVFAQEMAEFLMLLDGQHTVPELELALVRRSGGVLLPAGQVAQLLRQLDESFLLDSRRFREAHQRLREAFAVQKMREAALGGTSYPADVEELRQHLDGILAEGSIDVCGPVRALVAPHIDLAVGRKVYAAAYGALRGRRVERVVVLGTGHDMGRDSFCLTLKDFQTPLGTIPTCRAWVERLCRAGGSGVAADDFSHRREHSIEFQLLFLQHVLGTAEFDLVPILCGSMDGYLDRYGSILEVPQVAPLLCELRELLGKSDRTVAVVAGVDLSHVGAKFGHQRTARAMAAEAEAHDRTLLGALCRGDSRGFWGVCRDVKNRYHVCGFSALACIIELVVPCQGKVLAYEMAHEEATASAVSFAAVTLE